MVTTLVCTEWPTLKPTFALASPGLSLISFTSSGSSSTGRSSLPAPLAGPPPAALLPPALAAAAAAAAPSAVALPALTAERQSSVGSCACTRKATKEALGQDSPRWQARHIATAHPQQAARSKGQVTKHAYASQHTQPTLVSTQKECERNQTTACVAQHCTASTCLLHPSTSSSHRLHQPSCSLRGTTALPFLSSIPSYPPAGVSATGAAAAPGSTPPPVTPSAPIFTPGSSTSIASPSSSAASAAQGERSQQEARKLGAQTHRRMPFWGRQALGQQSSQECT